MFIMRRTICAVIAIQCILINFCLGELSSDKKDEFVNSFIVSLNNLPNPVYNYEEGVLIDAQKTDDNTYNISARLKASEIHNVDVVKQFKCSGTIVENANVLEVRQGHVCNEEEPTVETQDDGNTESSLEDITTESTADHGGPVKLYNEVQSDAEVTSGEQFVAIPRASPSSPCIGCASHVDPAAAGVTELATLGIRHLDLHDPDTKHALKAVVDVERQVQVVNGVRYILTLLVDYDNCTAAEAEPCPITTPCKVSILEKPWKKLPDGSKYRAIIANNCTADWLFGDEGEVLPVAENNENNEIQTDPASNGDGIKVVHNFDVEAHPNQDKIVTEEHLKNIEEQIIPYSEFEKSEHHATLTSTDKVTPSSPDYAETNQNTEQVRNYNENAGVGHLPDIKHTNSLSKEKKKAIDDIMHYFDFVGFDKQEVINNHQIKKRSYDDVLKLSAFAKNVQKNNKVINNASYIKKLAQAMINHLNIVDLVIHNRVLTDILAAGEEFKNDQHFFYLQALITIPCNKQQCSAKDGLEEICNGVIETYDENTPRILTAFCYEVDNSSNIGENILVEDPILIELVQQALQKIESEAPRDNAMKLVKILDATTYKSAGTLTKISISLAYTDCKKSVQFYDRMNCNLIENMGNNICQVEIYTKNEDDNMQIGYECTERRVLENVTDSEQLKKELGNFNDPYILKMAEESLRAARSDRKEKQELVAIKSVSTKLAAGLLTNLVFTAGYTNCDSDKSVDENICDLLLDVPLRYCVAEVWDRPWLKNSRQIRVKCKFDETEQLDIEDNQMKRLRKKRSKTSLLGGLTEQNVDDKKYKKLAQESFDKYRATLSSGEFNVKELKINKVTTQVVSGLITRIDFDVFPTNGDVIICRSKIYEQAWLNKKEITVNCDVNKDLTREKRSLPGGQTEQNVDDEKYKKLAQESLDKYRANLVGGELNVKELKVTKVTTQVVSGIKTRIDFNVFPTNGDVLTCHSEVYEQAWLNKKEITINCDVNKGLTREKRSVPGGQTEQNVDDEKYKKLAQESLDKYRANLVGGELNVKELKITKVTTQVVSGIKTRIDFNVFPTNGDVLTCHSEVYEQAWLNKKEITVNCDVNKDLTRDKRSLPGGQTEQNVNDEKYKKLAQESLNKYRANPVGGELNVKELKVTKVTTQVVSGLKTRIDFNVFPTNGDVLTCHSEVYEQAWLNKKEITINCDVNKGLTREKRSVPGGQTEQNVNDEKYKKLAQESLEKYRANLVGGELNVKELKVTKVTTQVVSGLKTRIDFNVFPTNGDVLTCHSEVYEQAWLNKKEITVNCDVNKELTREKRSLAGGQTEQNVDDEKYKKLAQESLDKYRANLVGGDLNVKELKVTKVTTQVVSGIKTRIDFNVFPTNGDVLTCHSEVYEQTWLNKKEITVNCDVNNGLTREKRSVPGGQTEQNVNDEKYKKLAQESLDKYRANLVGGELKVNLELKVTKVTTQVVSGIKTRIDFNVFPTNGDVLTCHSEVYEQAWLKKKEITINCDVNKQLTREKRSLPGGQTEQNVDDEKYKKLAQESLDKYRATLVGGELNVKELKVTKVTTQVVSGLKTRIDFNVFPTNGDVLTCHSEVYEQAWLNKKEITVNCDVNKELTREKRSLAGGQTEQNVDDEKYKKLAQESLDKYRATLVGGELNVKELKVTKVTTQVVSGLKTRIDFNVFPTNGDVLTCHSEVYEQAWLNKKEITVNCDVSKELAREKRSLRGGQTEKNVDDPKYKKLAQESLDKYRATLVGGELNVRELKLNKVTTQVVSGVITRIDFDVYPTNGDVITCHSNVHEQAWLNKKEITVECGLKNLESRKKRNILNSNPKIYKANFHTEDASKVKFRLLAEESLQQYMKRQNVSALHELVEIKQVKSQVVAGKLYEIDFTAAPSISQNNTILNCHAQVWSRPWLKSNEIDVTCTVDKEEGANTDVQFQNKGDVAEHNDEDVLHPQEEDKFALAQEVLHYYERLSNSKFKYKIISVGNPYKQITDNIVTMIEFHASPTQCLILDKMNVDECKLQKPELVLLCKSIVRERPWIFFKDIKVTCNDVTTTKSTTADWDDEIPDVKINLVGRQRRNVIGEESDNYMDDDMKYYYADRAVNQINQNIRTHNLQKLITIHTVDVSTQMGARMVRMYIETAMTFCVRHQIDRVDLNMCDEMDGLPHKLCHVRLWPSPSDEMVIRHVVVVCNDNSEFPSVAGFDIAKLISASLRQLESSPSIKYKLVHQGQPYVIPALSSRYPIKMNFVVLRTNCTKDIDVFDVRDTCFIDSTSPAVSCESRIYLSPNSKDIKDIQAWCADSRRQRRDVNLIPTNITNVDATISKLVEESLEKLETSSLHSNKQRILKINSYTTKITRGRETRIDFDVGYTTCLKYESVKNISNCEFLNNLPKRHCISRVYETLWVENGKNIEVVCKDDEIPLESQIEPDNAKAANQIANEALKHIEAKYPNPKKLRVVRIFSLQKQAIAGIHYRMKLEIGITDCPALSPKTDCKPVRGNERNKFCRVNVWIKPLSDHPPNFRVVCDYQESETNELYHRMQAEHLFAHFVATYKPDYMNDHKEMATRFKVFRDNVRKVHELNIHEKGTARYAMTRFSDLTYVEFSMKYLGLKPSLRNENDIPMAKAEIPKLELPQAFDWRRHGAVTEVKNQGSCGSCWAFSVTGNVEGQWKLHSGKLVSLSEQELVDCDKKDQGCNGGLMDNAYRAIEELGGLETETDYPYEGEDDKCVFNHTLSRVQISGAVNISSNETEMAQWLVSSGPISIGINANAMQFYVGGISHPWKMLCSPKNLDHGVLVVGFGIKEYPLFNKHLPYWIVKNSWGPSWGEQGYYRVYRGDGTCGVNQMASSAVV